MGTEVSVYFWHEDEAEGNAVIEEIFAEVDRINALMSTYVDDSRISDINRRAADEPVAAGEELFQLIRRSLDISVLTRGAFDITYDSVGQYYDFRERRRPDDATVEAEREHINFHYVKLDQGKGTVRFEEPGVRINLGGIAKGYAVEAVISLLRESGIESAMASAGGDTRLLGDRRGKPWIVGVRDPDDEEGLVTRLGLVDEAVSTSGDYERFFVEDGVRYHHILNPGTGRSASSVRSVSIIGPDATMTDGLSTSVFVLGAEKGIELIETLEGYEAIVVDNDRGVRFSTGLDPR